MLCVQLLYEFQLLYIQLLYSVQYKQNAVHINFSLIFDIEVLL